MIWNTLKKALGLDPNDRALRKYEGVVEQIGELSDDLEARSEDELRAMGSRLREHMPQIPVKDTVKGLALAEPEVVEPTGRSRRETSAM